jgi:hypothetical protein
MRQSFAHSVIYNQPMQGECKVREPILLYAELRDDIFFLNVNMLLSSTSFAKI